MSKGTLRAANGHVMSPGNSRHHGNFVHDLNRSLRSQASLTWTDLCLSAMNFSLDTVSFQALAL